MFSPCYFSPQFFPKEYFPPDTFFPSAQFGFDRPRLFEVDVLLAQTTEGGDMAWFDGQPLMAGGFETAAYLSLFGGVDWWGNAGETDPAKRYESRTQALLAGRPITSGNRVALEEAVRADLQWMLDENTASEVTAVASLIDRNRVRIDITVTAQGVESQFSFTENWRAMRAELT